jgi:hypothetical protein
MPVMLIHEDEKLKWTHAETGAGFIYRRPPSHVQRDIQAKFTERGVVDNTATVEELLSWSILGWFGFVDHHGAEAPYKKEYLAQVPELMKAAFIAELYGLDPTRAEMGN